MLSRRALIARLPIAAAPATSRRWLTPERPLAVDAGGNVEPAWTAADRANAQASAAPRKAFAMAAGVGLTTALGFYGVLCYSGDDGQETKQIEKPVSGLNPLPTSSEWSTTRTTTSPDKDARDAKRASGVTYNKSDDFAGRVADTDALPNYKATVGERLGKQSSRKIYGADTDEAPDDKPYSGRAVGDQPQRQVRSGDRPARGVYEEDRTSGDYNRYVRDSPAKDPRLDSDRPIVKAEPLIAGRATQQLDEKCQLELERQGSRSLLGRLSDRLFSTRKEPAENLRDSRESESEDKFSEQQTRGISTPDLATGDAGSLYRSGSHLPQRAMAELGAKDDDDNDKNDGDESGDGKKKNIFSKALSSVKGKFSHAANEAKDRLKGQRDSTSFDRDEQEGEDEERTYYTTGRPGEKSQNMRHSYHNPPSDETPKRYEKSSALERLKEEYEEHKDENRKKHDEEIEEAAKANDLSALAGPGHYRIRTKVSSEPFTARAAADEELDRNERIRAMENWSVLQGKQVAEQGRRWRARTANQSGVETTSVTGREPIRWFSRLSNEADVKADHYATSGHGSLERRRGIGSGESDDAEEKITGTGTHGDDEAGDTGKSADVQKQQRKLDEKARKSRNASASEPGRAGTGVRDDEPLTTKQLGAQEDRETIDMRG